MKKQSYLIILTLCLSLFTSLFAKSTVASEAAFKSTDIDEVSNPAISVVNINNMAYWIEKSGAGTTAGSPNGQQADYPIFTGGLIYEDGMLWGVKADEYPESAPVRVGGSTYYKGMKAGYVVHDADGNVVGADDPVNHHVWRVRTDFMTADLTKDAANFYATTASNVSAEQIQNVYDQYESDWMNWPAAWGAPYEDVDGNDSWDPNIDIPGYPGAHQTVWTISNDVPTIVDANGTPTGESTNTAPNLYGADPVGVELRVTMWGYAFGASDPLGNVVFKKAELTYTGLETSSELVNPEVLDSVYFTQWSDPDLGTYTDDYVGTDVDLSFGYVYNGNRLDGVFNGIYNLPCPAGGYDFLQGPADNLDIDGDGDLTEYLPMTSFTYFGAGSSISDPDLSSYSGSLQFFNLMEGYLPRPEYPTQVPWTDLSTGESTMFALSGDPVAGSGWIDGVQLPPGDRRLVMASGPYEMSKGETATVVLALVAGTGLDAVSSVSVAKYYDTYAQYAYDQGFSLPSAPTTPSLTATEMDGSISLDWGSDASAVSATEMTVSEGFEFEGYNVYQLPSAGSPLTEGVKVATFDKVNLVQNILDPDVDALTGLVVNVVKQTGSDAGVQRFYHTDYDEVRGRPMSNGVKYHFAVTAYSYLADNEGSPFKTLESGEARLAVMPHSANPGVDVAHMNGSDVTVDHNGTANASVNVNIVNSNNLKDETYHVNFDEQHFYRDLEGNWIKSETSGRSVGKVMDCSGSTVTASAIASAVVGTVDLILAFELVCPGGAWIDGIQMTFPDGFSSSVNSWGTTGGGNVCSYGTDSGQNCENLDGSWDGDVLLFGNDARTGFGAYESSNVFTVNYNPPADGFEAVTISYVVYDDGYDGTVVDGEGTTNAAELGYEYKTETHWNLSTDGGDILLEDQTFINGEDLYAGMSVDNMSKLHYNSTAAVTIDGFQVNVEGGYDSPNDAYGHEIIAGPMDISEVGAADFDVDSYAQNGWALTARAVDTWGSGITSVDYLQRDIQIRFTGEFDYDNPVTVGSGIYYPALGEGGSYCWIDGSRVGDFSSHPDPANTGTGSPFRIKVPFEVWDMEAEGGPQQIDITIYDRLQDYSGGTADAPDTTYAFNPYDRMYTHFIHLPYQEDGNYGADGSSGWGDVYGDGVGEIEENLTWNAVWWSTQFNQGDTLTFQYANPIQAGTDVFTFSMNANTVSASNDLSNVSVYPNPYYGFHELESARNNKFVSMNNLPQKATVKIYSLGGTFVREIEKDDEGQFAEWDLKNQYGYPVASGLYIMRITSGDEEKIVKLALVQETQVLKYY
jgi:hypothetical protein